MGIAVRPKETYGVRRRASTFIEHALHHDGETAPELYANYLRAYASGDETQQLVERLVEMDREYVPREGWRKRKKAPRNPMAREAKRDVLRQHPELNLERAAQQFLNARKTYLRRQRELTFKN